MTGCGDVDLAHEQSLIKVVTTTSYKQTAPPVVAPRRAATHVAAPDWAGFTRYIDSLRAWLTPPEPAPAPAPSVPARVPTPTGDYTTWPDWPLWHCTYRHESGGNWGFVGGRGGQFRGAFAIYIGTYRQFAPAWARALYSSPEQAPPGDQIRLARAIHSRIGHTQWGGLAFCISSMHMYPLPG